MKLLAITYVQQNTGENPKAADRNGVNVIPSSSGCLYALALSMLQPFLSPSYPHSIAPQILPVGAGLWAPKLGYNCLLLPR
jgi:hypothetical protein